MSGIYGTMLFAFPEQFRSFEYFNQDPLINDGYVRNPSNAFTFGSADKFPESDPVHGWADIDMTFGGDMGLGFQQPVTIRGILQTDYDDVRDGNGNIVKTAHEHLWTLGQLEKGWFIRFLDVVYRIMKVSEWPTEGGFYNYDLERLVGSNGDPQVEQAWDIGGRPL